MKQSEAAGVALTRTNTFTPTSGPEHFEARRLWSILWGASSSSNPVLSKEVTWLLLASPHWLLIQSGTNPNPHLTSRTLCCHWNMISWQLSFTWLAHGCMSSSPLFLSPPLSSPWKWRDVAVDLQTEVPLVRSDGWIRPPQGTTSKGQLTVVSISNWNSIFINKILPFHHWMELFGILVLFKPK